MIHLQNDFLAVDVNPVGAELSGLRSRSDGYEHLWQGDPAVWSGRSPLLFPVVGKLRGDRYTYGGKPYTLQKHGFARQETFRAEQQDASAVSLVLDNWEAHADSYPFQWRLTVRFSLEDGTLRVLHQVENLGGEPMYFSIGAHPGFFCGEGAYLEFPEEETVQAQRFNEEKIIRAEREPFLDGGRIFPLSGDLFVHDAIILEGLRSPFLTVCDPAHGRRVRVDFGGAPFLGLWARPNAPYICIEPWYGVDDDVFQTGAIEEKKGIVRLGGRDVFRFVCSITPLDAKEDRA